MSYIIVLFIERLLSVKIILIIKLGCLKWHPLGADYVATEPGVTISTVTDKELEECKSMCTMNVKCKSFMFKEKGGVCELHNKFIDENDPKKYVPGQNTYTKPAACHGNSKIKFNIIVK